MILFALTLLLAACNGGEKSSGEAISGADLFAKPVLGSQAGCKTCHSLEAGVTIVGPSLAGIASRAGSREAGKTAEEYLHESIVDPNQYIAEGYPADVMPKTYEKELNYEEIDSLVAYLITLK
jgi:cytochrome c2